MLERTVLTLAVGQRWDLGDLARRLAGAGYTRCDQVEGPGQFALRGGILDVFSPGMEQPVRCEFFDDEIDSLGIFDTATQRRVENRREALLLPAAEVLPAWQEGQAEQAALRLEAAVKRLARRQDTQALRELLTAAARRGSGELVVQVGYFDNQEEEVRSIVDQVQAMEAPEQKEPWTVNFYPEGGDVGIIEILLKKS